MPKTSTARAEYSPRNAVGVALALLLTIAGAVAAQPAAEEGGKGELDARAVGIDGQGFERLFVRGKGRPGHVSDRRSEVERLRIVYDPELIRRDLARVEARGEALGEAGELTVPVGDRPVTLNDRGEGADRKANDGIFSGTVELDLGSQLAALLKRSDGRLHRTAEGESFVFSGRELVGEKPFAGDEERAALEEMAPRLARLERLAPRLGRMSSADVVKALRIEAGETIFEIERAEGRVIERFLGLPPFVFANVLPAQVDPAASLMVTAVPVVEDPGRTFDPCTNAGNPGGVWTFAHLMREMAQGTGMSAEDLTLLWLTTWSLPQAANGFLVNDPARAAQLQARVINPWLAATGGIPDIERFPARLLAIVNRPDLADAVGYGKPGTGGEGRFVFSLLDGCVPLPFTVIFEYGVQVKGCRGLKSYQQQWKDLDLQPVGSPAYNAALEAITRQFTDHGSNPGQLPNQSSLNQLRTNEIALGAPWELREFTLQGPAGAAPGALGLVTVKQTPDLGLDNTPTLTAYIVSDKADILADKHVIPLRFPTMLDPFLGAKAPTPNGAFFWQAPGVLGMPNGADLRHKVSLATCSGCHAGETQTAFTHIGNLGNRNPGSPAVLSTFLTGMVMPDPGDPTILRKFNDLALRQQALANILNRTCFRLSLAPRFLPVTFPH